MAMQIEGSTRMRDKIKCRSECHNQIKCIGMSCIESNTDQLQNERINCRIRDKSKEIESNTESKDHKIEGLNVKLHWRCTCDACSPTCSMTCRM